MKRRNDMMPDYPETLVKSLQRTNSGRLLLLLAGLLLLGSSSLRAQQSAPPALKKYWVWFADKGPGLAPEGALRKGTAAFADASAILHPRALARRAKALPPDALLDAADLPLYEPYCDGVIRAGGVLQQQSRWLNAASFLLHPDHVSAIAALPGVRAVTPVAVTRGRRLPDEAAQAFPVPFAKPSAYSYGPSGPQDSAINIVQLHDLGVTGVGVLIGMLDSGFRWRVHESLRTRNVIAERDFVQSDDNTGNEQGDADDQDEHGTLTFSTIGGFDPGQIIGPAFGADFVLGKTEWIPGEIIWEEDNWAAAIEWMEGLGVDVVSSSLGYDRFDDTAGYSWANGDFNGRTAITSRAAARAARLGVLVCNSMGNEGVGDGITGTLLCPADADSILSIGAITLARRLAGFTSTGPTNDGRIKPDLAAPGAAIWCAYAPGGYWYKQGTSLSTPLAAGAASLVLSARPELTAQQVIAALRATADTDIQDRRIIEYPNNFVGWGAVNGLRAALSFGPIFSNAPSTTSTGVQHHVRIGVMSQYGIKPDSVLLYYAVGADSQFRPLRMYLDSAMVYETSGWYRVYLPQSTVGSVIRFYVEARDSSGRVYTSPAPMRQSVWSMVYGYTGVEPVPELPHLYRLEQNFPNPFNPSTAITAIGFTTPVPVATEIAVYNILGQRVRVLYQGASVPDRNVVQWDGRDEEGNELPSGIYLCRMKTPHAVSAIKMMLVR